MAVKLSMADMEKEPVRQRTTFPRPSAGVPSDYDFYLSAEDEERGTYMGMTESEFFGGDLGDK